MPDLDRRLAAVDVGLMDALNCDTPALASPTRRLAGAGGKRLRPIFTIVCAHLGGRFDEIVVAAAAAVELVQVGSLVHDDLFDGAATRRGVPAVNAVEGNRHAVPGGDYMVARAGELAATVSTEAAGVVAGR